MAQIRKQRFLNFYFYFFPKKKGWENQNLATLAINLEINFRNFDHILAQKTLPPETKYTGKIQPQCLKISNIILEKIYWGPSPVFF